MDNEIKISVVIPMYNTEKYIEECILSAIHGMKCKDDMEIIVVDDGSTDSSYCIVESLSKKHPNIILIHQENSGQSTARNKALEYAKGEYVFFLDSDDFINKSSLDALYDICHSNELDFIKTNWEIFSEEKNCLSKVSINGLNDILGKKMPAVNLFNKTISLFYIVCPWNGIFKREYILKNKLNFPEGIQFEDNTFTLKTYFADPYAYAMLIDFPFYNVRLRYGSTTSMKVSPKKIYDQIDNIALMNDFIEIQVPEKWYASAKKAVSSLTFTMTSYYYRLDKSLRKEMRRHIPKRVLLDAIKYPQTKFQKYKLIAFTYFPHILDIYEKLKNR